MAAVTNSFSSGSSLKKRHGGWRNIKENLTGYFFVLPAFLIIGVFGLFPIGYAVYMSTFTWRVRQGDFVGIDNYTGLVGDWMALVIFIGGMLILVSAYWVWNRAFKSQQLGEMIPKLAAAFLLIVAGTVMSMGWGQMMATGDKKFLDSLVITLYYAVLSVPAQLLLAMVLAYFLFQKIRGKELFRMIYFLPYVTPVVSTAVVFRTIFSPRETSLSNIVLSWFGIEPLKWLFEWRSVSRVFFGLPGEGVGAGPSLALVTVVIFGVWTFVGYNTVIFLAGLGAISKEIYEAAEIDGAGGWGIFWNITFPLLSPVTFYLTLISFIGTFKAFNHIFVMQTPSAQGTVGTASVYIFDMFYKANLYGTAASQAVLLFIIIAGLTFAQNKLLGDRVFYG